jgi:ABC-type oligopeptide transport system substrate-binding subunit/DNA-binding SARP family transcriptional activator
MPSLSLSVLGPFEAKLNGRPLGRFRTKSAQALLIYLACQPEQTHRREHLMTMLWPGLPQKSAQASLRQALYLLRKAIPELDAIDGSGEVPFLTADRQTIQVNPAATFDLDATTLERLLAGSTEAWPEAITLYRGDFLADFYLPDSAPFEEWVLARREGLRRKVLEALEMLTGQAIETADYETAGSYARRQIEIDNLRESGHRQLMESLALSGRRTEALAHYDNFRLLLERELAAEPSLETVELYERILADKLAVSRQPTADSRRQLPVRDTELAKKSKLPSFFQEGAAAEQVPFVFVSRESELNWLDEQFSFALQGQGKVAFISGDAGSGKSTLLRVFARQASVAHPDMLVAWGSCNAFSGSGDPYLPFCDILNTLTGDVEGFWSAGTLTREQAQVLWLAMPEVTQALLDHGPDLLDTFIPSTALVKRISELGPVANTLQSRLQQQTAKGKTASSELEQPQLFEQLSNVMHELAKDHPLLLLIDDLQWVDSGSINLLFHLGRRLASRRILVVGSYRPEEVSAGRNDKQHPLQPILDEFKRIFGDIWLDLNQASSRDFVDAFLDSENNRLDEDFREILFSRTEGHPLFTIELLRDLQERGDLMQDEDGYWIAGPELDWESLPARVEGVIAARIDRLEDELREILNVAAVEGEDFTAQVIARIQQLQERQLLKTLSVELDRRYRLIRERVERKLGSNLLSRYKFAHVLFQQYLYNDLSVGERRLLHGEIADILEELYAERLDEVTVQLAWHYVEAGDSDKALPYLLQAGDNARALYAFDEAIHHYERALAIYKDQGDTERASRMLMKLGLTYHSAFDYERSRQAYKESFRLGQQSSLTPPATHLPPAPHALRLISGGDVLTLDPGRHNDGATGRILGQLFSGLIFLTPGMNVVPNVARSWEVLDNGQTYLFHLRDDVRWSDGLPVTAHDFVLGWRRALDPENGSPAASSLYDVRGAAAFHQGEDVNLDVLGIKALDEWTLRIDLEQPSSYFLYILAQHNTLPVPDHIIASHGDAWTDLDNFVSNGPFRLESYQRGRSMVLRRNPTYHGQFRGNLEVVQLHMVHEEIGHHLDDFVRGYEDDEYDILDLRNLLPTKIQRAIQRHATDYVTGPELSTVYVSFDVRRPPFDDPRVRQAFVLATDRQTLIAITLMGSWTPATGGFIPLGMPGHVPGIALPFDPRQARRLLAEAGYRGGQGFPNVSALTNKLRERYVEALSNSWRSGLGVEISWELLEWSAFVKRKEVKKDPPHIHCTGWSADYPDPDNFMRLGKEQATNWDDEAYGTLVEQARRVMDHNERMLLYRQAEEILVREAPFFPIYYTREDLLVKPWIKNYRLADIGQESLKDVIIDPH